METNYIPAVDFAVFIKSLPEDRVELVNIDGFNRWVVTNDDGTKYIVRPN